jgi:hypothetical protein
MEAWRDEVPPFKILPLSFKGEGDKGGEVIFNIYFPTRPPSGRI